MMRMFVKFFVVVFFVSSPYAMARPCSARAMTELEASGLREADVIFISSSSGQSDMLEEATESIWTHVGVLMKRNGRWGVAEAAARVTWTPLESFVRKSRASQVSLKRIDTDECLEERNREPTRQPQIICDIDSNIGLLREALIPMMGKPYDSHFQPDDERIYCSELTQKAFERAFGIQLGQVETFAQMLKIPEGKTWEDLPPTSHVYNAIVRRFDGGRSFDPNTKVVSPVSQYNSDMLQDVYECRESVHVERRGSRSHE
jgi:hypothetical protein